MRAPLPDAATIAELLAPRMLIHCPPAELNAAVPYQGWSDVDALVRGTTMRVSRPQFEVFPANAVISLGTDLLHYPALDIDGEAFVGPDGVLNVQDVDGDFVEWRELGDCALIPSAHHHHAYCTQSFTWGRYASIIEQMADVACLGRGWTKLSLMRGFTLLRHPLHPKPYTPKEKKDEVVW